MEEEKEEAEYLVDIFCLAFFLKSKVGYKIPGQDDSS